MAGPIDFADARWFQRAVFYEVLVRGFNDATGDGTGDLKGLTEKLDYLEWLGVGCLWLLPFYQSPLGAGGYDMSGFLRVVPAYGRAKDAVPYLFEREGTNSENLPETHEYLKRVRRTVDVEFPGRVLLAEANQWPADVVEYFGDGDECHMCFHFPLMPRMFMAVRREQRYPVTEILAQTPEIPDGCQWGIFLRNHDELTLEMVSDEDRDYMYSEYATDPRMKVNFGIRRRLAPLVDND